MKFPPYPPAERNKKKDRNITYPFGVGGYVFHVFSYLFYFLTVAWNPLFHKKSTEVVE